MLNLFLDGYEAKITTKTWASLAKCSADTALRDIHDLVGKGVLREDIPGAKRPSYSIIYEPDDLTALFSEVRVEDENGRFYLKSSVQRQDTGMRKGFAIGCGTVRQRRLAIGELACQILHLSENELNKTR